MFERWMECAIYCSREIDAPPAVVWSLMRDIDSQDKVLSGVTRVEWLDRSSCQEQPNVAVDSGEDATEDDDAPRRRRRVAAQLVPKDDVIRVGMRFRIHRVDKDGVRYSGDWVVTQVENFARDNNREDDNTASVNAESASPRIGKPEFSVTFYSANVMGGLTCLVDLVCAKVSRWRPPRHCQYRYCVCADAIVLHGGKDSVQLLVASKSDGID